MVVNFMTTTSIILKSRVCIVKGSCEVYLFFFERKCKVYLCGQVLEDRKRRRIQGTVPTVQENGLT
jgi:hypothetical protein